MTPGGGGGASHASPAGGGGAGGGLMNFIMLPAIFLFGGLRRGDPARRISLFHGDAVVWGGPSRLAFHGVAPVKPGEHPLTGACRIM